MKNVLLVWEELKRILFSYDRRDLNVGLQQILPLKTETVIIRYGKLPHSLMMETVQFKIDTLVTVCLLILNSHSCSASPTLPPSSCKH